MKTKYRKCHMLNTTGLVGVVAKKVKSCEDKIQKVSLLNTTGMVGHSNFLLQRK